MEAKKNPAIDIYKMSGLFYSIGLVVSMALVYGVFHIKFADNISILELSENTHQTEEILDIPATLQPPPPPPKLQLTQIVEVSNEQSLIDDIPIVDMEMQENTSIEAVAYDESNFDMGINEEEVDEIFLIVEKQAEPVDGVKAFYEYIASQLKGNYPKAAERMDIQGVVYLQFVVEKDGSLTDIKVVKGIGGGCDELAIKVLQSAPKWNPGKQRGKAVRTSKMVPIRFILKRR